MGTQHNPQVDEAIDMMEERTEEPAAGAEVKVWGNLVAFVERLDDEMFKSLQVRRGWMGLSQRRRGGPCLWSRYGVILLWSLRKAGAREGRGKQMAQTCC